MVLDKHVGFIGAGQMAEALARGFSDKGIVPAENMHCTDISKARRDLFQEFGAHAYEKAAQVRISVLIPSTIHSSCHDDYSSTLY